MWFSPMPTPATASIFHHFAKVTDPRINRQKKHQLGDIFFITLCAVISGADNWVMIEEFGQSKEAWFTKQLGLQHGIPSHDTLGDVFAAIDSEQFSQCFSSWVADLASLTSGDVIAIDGKTVRRSVDKASGKAAIHLVSAWAQRNSLVLGQVKVDDKSNEITAIPALLASLDLKGAVVTIDAMGCQTAIAQQIVQQQGDYVLSLKENQPTLYEDVTTWFTSALAPTAGVVDIDAGHGRIETRTVRVCEDIEWLRQRHPHWVGLRSILAITATREFKGKDTIETQTRYFISSLDGSDPTRLGQAVRAHWAVENNLHWVLDVAFDEDHNRTRCQHSATNLSIIRHIALNLLKLNTSTKVGIKTKRAKAGWDHRFLLQTLKVI